MGAYGPVRADIGKLKYLKQKSKCIEMDEFSVDDTSKFTYSRPNGN